MKDRKPYINVSEDQKRIFKVVCGTENPTIKELEEGIERLEKLIKKLKDKS